jgi:hypothetical protein
MFVVISKASSTPNLGGGALLAHSPELTMQAYKCENLCTKCEIHPLPPTKVGSHAAA